MKSQKGYVLVLKTLPREATLKRAWYAVAAQITRWYALHRERRQMMTLSDAGLKDLGLTRADIYGEAERPFWDDPMKH